MNTIPVVPWYRSFTVNACVDHNHNHGSATILIMMHVILIYTYLPHAYN